MDNKSKTLKILGIARSTFYYPSLLDSKDTALKTEIEKVWAKHHGYGYRRLTIHLDVNEKRVRRVMRKYGLKPPRRRKKPRNRGKNRDENIAPNLLASLTPLFKNHVWITDFTYLRWRNCWIYVATIIDLFTREVLGVSIKTHRGAILVSEALLNALVDNKAPTIIHSDQGSEYKSKLFQSILAEAGILPSMSKKASPWQNGYQESFYGNWKVDLGDVNRFNTVGELVAEIYHSIYYYNKERIHTSLGMPPKKFADKYIIKYNTNQERKVV